MPIPAIELLKAKLFRIKKFSRYAINPDFTIEFKEDLQKLSLENFEKVMFFLMELFAGETVHTLRFENNKLTLQKLETLFFTLSQINILNLSFKKENLSGNKLFTNYINHACSLQTLDLSSCRLTAADLNSLSLKNHLSLYDLDLSNNPLGDQGIIQLATLLESSPIKHLYIYRTNMTKEGLAILLEKISELHRLEIGYNPIGSNAPFYWQGNYDASTAMPLLAHWLAHRKKQMSYLGVEGGGLNETDVISLREAIIQSPGLLNLNICRNPLGDILISLLRPLLEVKEGWLEYIQLADCGLTAKGAQEFAAILSQPNSLRKALLSENPIENEGAQAVFSMLEQNQQLYSLQLNNVFQTEEQTDATAYAIARALSFKKTCLSNLFLSQNKLTAQHIAIIAEGLSYNERLKVLNLSKNTINSEGTCIIASKLNLTQLTRLDISSNQINGDSMQALGDALRENETLTELSLANNDINRDSGLFHGITSSASVKKLIAGIAENKSLQVLRLSGNPHMSSLGDQECLEILKNNRDLLILELNKEDLVGFEINIRNFHWDVENGHKSFRLLNESALYGHRNTALAPFPKRLSFLNLMSKKAINQHPLYEPGLIKEIFALSNLDKQTHPTPEEGEFDDLGIVNRIS